MSFKPPCQTACCLASILIIVLAFQELGCTNTKSLRPYFSWENDHFREIKVPSRNEILAKAKRKYTRIFEGPLDQVWKACLDIAIQGGGILGLKADSDESYQLLFVANEPRTYQPLLARKLLAEQQPVYVEAWIAVNVHRIEDAKDAGGGCMGIPNLR